MHVDFLLGPAGSGKTTRCLREIRAALEDPDGPPLLLLAPKQATFQLERQILATGEIAGYARLQILSFERLAELVLEHFDGAPPLLIEEEGRLMVLRALLMEQQPSLRIFHATARLPGFARQLSLLLRECQRSQISSKQLALLSQRLTDQGPLGLKLADLSLLLRVYLEWLDRQGLQDANCLLDLATARLLSTGSRAVADPGNSATFGGVPVMPALRLAGLWLDGFAEMTPQELDLLAAVIPCVDRATLSFCMDHQPMEDPSWLSTWAVVGQTVRRCWHRLVGLPGVDLRPSLLRRDSIATRFNASPALAHLESNWAAMEPEPFVSQESVHLDGSESSGRPGALPLPIRVVRCANLETEAVLAAREVLRHVRDSGGRYREVAILVRSLESYHVPLRRVFTRYGIPFFMDRREPAGHHPLAELTRSALRVAALHWQQDDLFSALKTGLIGVEEAWIDALENAALANGWRENAWLEPLKARESTDGMERLEALRKVWVAPFISLQRSLSLRAETGPTGGEVAGALRRLWNDFGVAQQLEEWAERAEVRQHQLNSMHLTVLEGMQSWVRNLELAFADRSMPLREWLPILEAGLGSLTVGVIPPALDQVVMGAIDRSRSSDLRVVIVMGMNETVFPALPSPPKILTESERVRLVLEEVQIGTSHRRQLGHERYYGYIACTRASERLVLTFAASGSDGASLNPSPFVGHIRRLFPTLQFEEFSGLIPWNETEHPTELGPLLLRNIRERLEGEGSRLPEAWEASLAALPEFSGLILRQQQLFEAHRGRALPSMAVDLLYSRVLTTSVSALEDFSACPFKFFVARGLGAKERERYEPDVRELGSFQHELLREVHQHLAQADIRWRDLTPADAERVVLELGEKLLVAYRGGLFQTSAEARFVGSQLVQQIRLLFSTLVGWMPQYQFDPVAVELDFGFGSEGLGAWELPVDAEHSLRLRGRIDRIDIRPASESGPALAVIIDYKSSRMQLEPVKLQNGLQLQLLSYLGLLQNLPDLQQQLGVPSLEPAGVFYVSLKPAGESLTDEPSARKWLGSAAHQAYQHRGRFNRDLINDFDSRGCGRGDQFSYALKKDGGWNSTHKDPMSPADFRLLLQEVSQHLMNIGGQIFRGHVEVSPYQWKKERACDRCDFQSVCRFDPWSDPFRILRADARDRSAKNEAME